MGGNVKQRSGYIYPPNRRNTREKRTIARPNNKNYDNYNNDKVRVTTRFGRNNKTTGRCRCRVVVHCRNGF